MTFLTSALGLAVIGFYFYMAVAFYRVAVKTLPTLNTLGRIVFALTWPATVWVSGNNPAR